MSFSERLSSTGSRTLPFSRRDLVSKSFAIALAVAVGKRSRKLSAPKDYPAPKFAIGDLVSEDWEAEDAQGVEYSATDFGEVLGLRWVSEAESWLPQNTWIYFVRWTHSTSDVFSYPTYDGEPCMEDDLKLVSYNAEPVVASFKKLEVSHHV